MTPRTVWLSGAGGFIGHHTLEHILSTTSLDVTCTDSFRHKGVTDRIRQVLDDGYPGWTARTKVVTHDLAAPFSEAHARHVYGAPDYMIAMASESHVDRSIGCPGPFISNNVAVMVSTLELARLLKPRKVIVISTDEVYGPVSRGNLQGHEEWAPVLPSNPYAGSKACQEAIAIAYWRTYGVPVIIVNCMNLIGERQDPEKFVPKTLRAVLAGEMVTIHGRKDDIGTRHYLHARNLADALCFLLDDERPLAMFPAHSREYTRQGNRARVNSRPDRYNVASADRIDNLTLAKLIATYAGRELHYELADFHTTRPGHDPHYGLDPAKLTALGWTPPVPFDASLKKTVEWTMAHPHWLGL